MKIVPSFFSIACFFTLVYGVFGSTPSTVSSEGSPLRLPSLLHETGELARHRENEHHGFVAPRSENSEVPLEVPASVEIRKEQTWIDKIMSVIGNPVGTLWAVNEEKVTAELASPVSENRSEDQELEQEKILKDAYQRLALDNSSEEEKALGLLRVKQEYQDRGIHEIDGKIFKLAGQQGARVFTNFIFLTFDDALSYFPKNEDIHGTVNAAAIEHLEEDPEAEAKQLLAAAINSTYFLAFPKTSRLKWCLSWASGNCSDEVLAYMSSLAHAEEAIFGSREDEKKHYEKMYDEYGPEVLGNQFEKLCQQENYEKLEAAMAHPDDVADLLMTVRSCYSRAYRESHEGLEQYLINLAELQGARVRTAFLKKVKEDSSYNKSSTN